jgi:hypothetical protein
MEPEQMVGEVRIVGFGHEAAAPVASANVIADRPALCQHAVAVGDDRRDPHRV